MLPVCVLLLACMALAEPPPTHTWQFVESIPTQIDLRTETSTFEGWKSMLEAAQQEILIAAFYVTLTEGSQYPDEDGGWQGQMIYDLLVDAHESRGVQIKILQNEPDETFPDYDSFRLAAQGIAEVRSIDWDSLQPTGSGIMHTKLIIVDRRHLYVGSANMDWRSLTQVKEMGVVIWNTPELADDMNKVFDEYWLAANFSEIPPDWPIYLDTLYNEIDPGRFFFNGELTETEVFVAVSPPNFCTSNRTEAIAGTIGVIDRAQEFVHLEVMDYYPGSFYMYGHNFFWPDLDCALRRAAFRGVKVELLFSLWNHTYWQAVPYFRSLDVLDNVTVRWFVIPPLQGSPTVPYSRVNHSKFFVTEQEVYITTNNWTADYYVDTAGLAMVSRNPDFASWVEEKVFSRDWNSDYTIPLLEFLP